MNEEEKKKKKKVTVERISTPPHHRDVLSLTGCGWLPGSHCSPLRPLVRGNRGKRKKKIEEEIGENDDWQGVRDVNGSACVQVGDAPPDNIRWLPTRPYPWLKGREMGAIEMTSAETFNSKEIAGKSNIDLRTAEVRNGEWVQQEAT